MSEFPHKAYDRWVTQSPDDHWATLHHEDDFEENLEDIEEDEQDAYTRCEKCGCRVMLKNMKKHRRVKHG